MTKAFNIFVQIMGPKLTIKILNNSVLTWEYNINSLFPNIHIKMVGLNVSTVL